MNKTSTHRPVPRLRAPLLQGCALAMVLALAGQSPLARATGFQGTGTVVPGSGSASIISGATSDTIIIDTAEVVIDWVPSDTAGTGTINFLPTNNSVLYMDNSSALLTGYTVLNRILPVDGSGNPVIGRPVAFNGTVTTQLGAANFPVGNVWFYSPGGIIAGPSAIFNVGGLVLTSSIIDATSGFGSSGGISFTGTPNSASSVEIQGGAQINVVNPGSYVALVAPRVVQAGAVRVNGSVAYIGAEAADITINGGLFDISIGTGTGDANGVVHTGTTNLTPDAGTQRAFIAAVPKNAALTMLLTGTFGYSPAASAAVQDSAVILSAGHDISFGQSVGTPNSSTSASANISVGNSSFSSAIDGRATGSITINPTGSGTISFDQNAAFKAGISITAGADDSEAIDALADLSLSAGVDGTGGIATLYADGTTPTEGRVTVGGILTVGSSAIGLDDFGAGATGGDATGGTSEIRATGGTISAGSIVLLSDAMSGFGSAASGDATGGTARIALTSVNGGGSISAGAVSVDVSARGPFSSSFPPLNGGSAMGGTVQIGTDGGLLGIAALDIRADAEGGSADVGGTAGLATGGNVTISSVTSGTGLGIIAITDCASFSCSISANATGGNGPDGANGTGGNITLTAQDGFLASDSFFSISADGLGGAEGPGGTTGSGFGGDVLLQVLPGSVNNGAMIFGDLDITADGAGLPIPGDYSGDGNGGLGQGGSVRINVLGGAFSATTLAMGASGLGGPAAGSPGPALFTAGEGIGGQSTFTLNGGFADIGTLSIYATGEGGLAQFPSFTGDLMGVAGNGTGGTSQLIVTSGTMNVGDIFIHAYGLGGTSDIAFDQDSTIGGDGTGGTAEFIVDGGTLIATSAEIFANGEGGAGGEGLSTGNAGSGGNGTGGTASVSLGTGNMTLSTLNVAANGTGGAGGNHQGTGNAGSGGDGAGGTALLDGNDASYALGAVRLEALGIGGAAGAPASGLPGSRGDGTGGVLRVTNRDTVTPASGRSIDSLALDVSGVGLNILSGRMELSDVATFAGGGLVITGDLTATGLGPAASSTSGFYFTGAGESISIGGNATIDTAGTAAFMLDGTGAFTVTGALQIDAGQDIFVGHTNNAATPVPSIDAGSVAFASNGDIDGTAGSLISGTAFLTLNSLNGSISTNRLTSGGTTQLDAANGGVTVATDLQSAGDVQATGQSIDIRSLGTLNASLVTASAGDLSLLADDGLTIATGTASGAIILGSTLGDIAVTDLTGATIDIGTFGSANFAGLSDAQSLQVNSSDVAIGAGAQLGVIGTTTLITLANSRTVNPTFIGGADNSTGYSLSAAELNRLFSDDIEIVGTFGGLSGPDVVVDSFTMASRASTPTGNLGANGSLSIISGGNLQIVGDVALTGLGSGNQLFFRAEGATTGVGAIEIDAANASISLTDANGALAGQVNFEADEVFIATPEAITDVRAESSVLAIGLRLGENDGVVRNNGVVRAATIFVDVGNGLYIQNVGATADAADRRGFAALTDTLDIATASPATRIVVNGQLVDAVGGTVLSGLDVLPLIRISGVVGATSGNFDPSSTVNGCVIASPLACRTTIDIPGVPPPYDTIDQPLDPDGSTSGPNLFPTIVVELKGFEPFGYPPLIDEPVTGAGNDDLWMPACEEDRSGCPVQ